MNFTLFLVLLYTIISKQLFVLQNVGNIIPNIRELNEVSKIKTFMCKNFVCLFVKLICDMREKGIIVCLFKLCKLITNSLADKPKWAGS